MLPISKCPEPWSNLLLYPDNGGAAAPCCSILGDEWKFPFSESTRIVDVFNSPSFKMLRGDMASCAALAAKFCKHCSMRQADYDEVTDFDAYLAAPEMLDDMQMGNMLAARNAFVARETELTSLPCGYLLFFGYQCNIDCVMCNRSAMHRQAASMLKTGWLENSVEELRRAVCIHLSGGEPLLLPNAIHFMEWMLGEPRLQNVALMIGTNALWLDRFTPMFLGRKVRLQISLDSYGRHYDAVRRGSSWRRVADNVDEFVRLMPKVRLSPTRANVHVHCTVTRTGLPGLYDLVRWAVDRGFSMTFKTAEFREGLDLSEESFRLNPKLLRQVPEWRETLARSVEYLERHAAYPGFTKQLRQIFHELVELDFVAHCGDDCPSGTGAGHAVRSFPLLRARPGKPGEIAWETSRYGKDAKSTSAIAADGDALVFYAADARDHAATPFFPAAVPGGRSRFFELSLTFPPAGKAGMEWNVRVQNREYRIIAEFAIRRDAAETAQGMEIAERFMTTGNESEFRLVFSPRFTSGAPYVLPSRIEVDVLTAVPEKGGRNGV